MPVECHFCRNNKHGDDGLTTCTRIFLSFEEALPLVAKSGHTFIQGGKNGTSLLIGADHGKEIKYTLEDADWIEICDPTGEARKMKHGLAAQHGKTCYFIETNEKKLRRFEKEIGRC